MLKSNNISGKNSIKNHIILKLKENDMNHSFKKKFFSVINWLLVLALVTALVACGGSQGGDEGGGGGDEGTTTTVSAIDLSANPTTIMTISSAASNITINALDSGNAVLSGQNVTLTTTSGILSTGSVTTPATVTLTCGSSKINRTATITARAGSITATIPIQITGSTATLTSSATSLPNDGSTTIVLTVAAKDAGNNLVSGAAVTLTQTGTGSVTFGTSSGTTNASGQFTTTARGAANGTVTVTANVLGATASVDLTVSPAAATFAIDQQLLNSVLVPGNPDPTAMHIGDALNIRVNVPAGITNVTFATTIGAWDGGASKTVTKAASGGKADATLSTTQIGIATVQVYDAANPSTSDTLTVAMSSNAAPAKILLEASPGIVPISVGTTTGSSTLTAKVYDASNNPLGGQPVAFSIVEGTGTSGGEFISPVVVLTATTTGGGLSVGDARSSFTSGSKPSAGSGVQIRASVVGTTVETEPLGVNLTSSGNDAPIVIGGVAGSIAFGQATVIAEDSTKANYIWPMSVLVADSNGNAVANQTVNLSVWPIAWSTGEACSYDPDGERCDYSTDPPTCVAGPYGTFYNEDVNENIIMDAGEDGRRYFFADNKDATISGIVGMDTPTLNTQLTPANSAGGTVPATVVTDANGVAGFNLTYRKQSAIWTVVRIRATTSVSGSETRGEIILRLPCTQSDCGGACLLGSSQYFY